MSGVMDQERFDRIRLARSDRVGPISFRQLIRRFGSAGEALRVLPDIGRRGGKAQIRVAPYDAIAREVEQISALGGYWLVQGDHDYPALLTHMEDAPPVMTCRGNRALLGLTSVAMVGARNASAAACRLARDFAHDLSADGLAVVSGLARGIDTAAHQGALAGGGIRKAGGTIAIIASGIDIAYPPENAALQERIAQEGLLIAEQSPGAEPKARNFPHRNRIIAGLAQATLVVEAAPQSGSLITARLAGEYGRDVLAVPGSPLDPRARGCNALIREGAVLVQSPADVMEALSSAGGLFSPVRASRQVAMDFEEAIPMSDPQLLHPAALEPAPSSEGGIESLLGPVPVPVDEVIRQSGLAPSAVQMALLELELSGRLERHNGGKISLREEI